MKKLFTTLLLMVITLSMSAVPAKKGIYHTIRLANGTEVRAQLMGDEHLRFYQTEDGQKYMADGDVFVKADMQQLAKRAATRRAAIKRKGPRKTSFSEPHSILGQKKGLVLLAQFSDVKFKSNNGLERYQKVLNEKGYTTDEGFKGCVSDYFRDQSRGQLEFDFDVVGPFTMPKKQSYYGGNDYGGNDKHPDEMVVEACLQADSLVNFADYDWDGDGEVDQIFVVYAGKGEADGGSASTIWPHMYMLEATGKDLNLDGVKVSTYACSNELDGSGKIEGIGCFCHEFSHCMGFPDMYDTSYSGWFGMGSFDLMCSGSYNGDTYIPAGYSAWERYWAGWLTMIELDEENVQINNLKPMSEDGEAYVIYNKAHPNEYYTIENRQKTNWDAALPGKGLMIGYIDFDPNIWEENNPNTPQSAGNWYGYTANDHERITIFHADNNADKTGYTDTQSTDLYPYLKKDSLTATSKPAATLHHASVNGDKIMPHAIFHITQNEDGTMSFFYSADGVTKELNEEPDEPVVNPDEPDQPVGAVLLYESFDQCNGKGGNDGIWKTSIASSAFVPDLEGWETDGNKNYGGYKCARFGNGSTVGIVTTPEFTLNGKATLTCKVAGWTQDPMTLDLVVAEGDATVEVPADYIMDSFAWKDFTATITGNGKVRLKFVPGKRFLLDEVTITKVDEETGINLLRNEKEASKIIFTIDGRMAGTDLNALPKGIYIVNHKKVIKK